MKWYIVLLALAIASVGCASNDIRSTSQPQKSPPLDGPREQTNKPARTTVQEKDKETPPGTPVASANYQMKEAQEKMTDTLKLIERTQDGDIVLDCKKDALGSFEIIAGFFNHRSFFQYNNAIFWFETNDGKQVGIAPDAEPIKCRFGRWWTNKMVICYQYRGESEIRTEFYIDEKVGTLSVHRYLDDKRISNENHVLKGY